jgi:regulator of sirC expression with transglutaminase-like and TPR domain
VKSDYSCDSEFLKMVTRRTDVNLTVAALEIARDADPDLDFHQTFDWIEARGQEVSRAVAKVRNDADALRELGSCLAGKHGIFGDRDSYEHAESSYLNRVIERKRGIPISLSVLYMAVAAPAGLTLHGISSPGHFLTRYESVDGPLFLDAFAQGEILTYDECVERFSLSSQLSQDQIESALEPAAPRTIIMRMLNNLKALHAKQENWQAAWNVQHRLTALQPTSYSERRDLALISVKAHRPGFALDLLETCRRHCPDDETEILEGQIAEAKRQISRWN